MAIERIVASLAQCIFTITKIEDYVSWVKDEVMPNVQHVIGKIESDKLGDNGLPLYTQIGFFISTAKLEKFEPLIGTQQGLPQSPIRPLLYNTGRGHRNVQVEPTSRATIEIIFGGYDPLEGIDYYFDPKNRIANRGGWSVPQSNAHAANTEVEVGEDEEVTLLKWGDE